jgi:acyl-CoA synthetase (AMP-forming)/AMP-acid ligase II
VTHWLNERIQTFAERPFLSLKDTQYTYIDLSEAIQQAKETFTQAGIRAGHITILNGDYTLNAIAALLALFELKAMVAPIATDAENERQQRIQASNAQWEIHTESHSNFSIQALNPAEETHTFVASLKDNQEAGLILFSSGSTGKPKAMIHSADRLLSSFQSKRQKNLNILIFLLFDHIGGLNTLFNGLSTGALIVAPQNRDPETIAQAIQTHKVKLLPASPTFLNLFLISGVQTKYDLSSLRFITYGTEPMPQSLLKRIKEAFPRTKLIQTFGTSETGISQTTSRSSTSTLIKFDDPNTEYKIVDGELWLRSKSQILGYLNHEMSRFTEDGWFKTGDLLEPADEDEGQGYFRIVGRKQEIINVGGEKVTPSEVESTLLEMPEIADCLVYAESNAITGQIVAAEIVLKAGNDPKVMKRAIKNYCRAQLSPYKIPARIQFKEATNFSNRFKKMRIKE